MDGGRKAPAGEGSQGEAGCWQLEWEEGAGGVWREHRLEGEGLRKGCKGTFFFFSVFPDILLDDDYPFGKEVTFFMVASQFQGRMASQPARV